MPILQWPCADQPREKLLTNGAHNLTDAELIAILFNTGTRGAKALDVAKALLRQHGDLKQLIHTKPSLLQQKGVGSAKYATLQAAIELGKRYLSEIVRKGQTLNNSRLTQTFLSDRLKHQPVEVFACLYMDTHLRLIQYEELFHGTINEATVYPREIVRRGLLYNAAKVILAHNHPSGIATPSAADKDITRLIKQTLALVDMVVIDHVIVGTDANFSFAENHLI